MTYLLRQRQVFPITIQYLGVDDGEVLFSSEYKAYGMRGETYYLQPENGLLPYGWDVLDSSEYPVVLGTDTVAKFPIQEQQTYKLNLIWMNAANNTDIVQRDMMEVSGFAGNEIRGAGLMEKAPYGWTLKPQDAPIITLGKTDTYVLPIWRTERFAVTCHYLNDATGDEVSAGVAYCYGIRGEEAFLDYGSACPDGWMITGQYNSQIALGQQTEFTVMVVPKTVYEDQTEYKTYVIRADLVDRETGEALGRQWVTKRGAYMTKIWLGNMDIQIPEGYVDWFRADDIWLGVTDSVTVRIYRQRDDMLYTFTLRGVNALDPTEVLQETELILDRRDEGGGSVNDNITPPEGYTFAGDYYYDYFYGGGITESLYYLMPEKRYERTLVFVDEADPSHIVERRTITFAAPDAHTRTGMRVEPPEGWHFVRGQSGDSEWLTLYGWQTGDITMPVAGLDSFDVAVELVNAYRPSQMVAMKLVAVQGERGTRGFISRKTDDDPLGWDVPCPEGWEFLEGYPTISVVYGQTQRVQVLVKPKPADTTVTVLPRSLTAIGANAFAGTQYAHIVARNGLASIGAGAFAGCDGLYYLDLPSSVTSIDPTAFDGCNRLVILCTKDSYAHQFAKDHGLSFSTGRN